MPHSPEPLATVIIVSYNVCGDLRDCLRSIEGSDNDDRLQVIVVDNASADDTVAMVRREFPRVQVLANTANVGFPKANNQALALARAPFVLFLNPDTLVMPATVSTCVRYLSDHAEVGVVGCKVQLTDGAIQLECARNYPSLDAMVWEAFYLHMLFPRSRLFGKTLMSYWDHQDSREVPCLVGAFMLTRRSILESLGGMDETVFLFMDDVDLCYRIRDAGWKVFYLADISIVHKSERSRRTFAGSLMAFNAEAKYAFFRKHVGLPAALACRFIYLVQGIFRLAASLVLYPVAAAFPRAKRRLRSSWIVQDHWRLVQWSLFRRVQAAS